MDHAKIQVDAHAFVTFLTGSQHNSLSEYSVDSEGLGSIVFQIINPTDVIFTLSDKMAELNWTNRRVGYFDVVDVREWLLKGDNRKTVTLIVKFDRDIELILTNK